MLKYRSKASDNMKTRRGLLSFIHALEGISSLEFAIVAPILILLVTGIVEFSLVMYDASILEGALAAGAREGRTGFNGTSTGANQSYVYSIIQSKITGAMDPNKVVIAAQCFGSNYASITPIGTCTNTPPYTNANPQCPTNVGSANDIVAYQVTYPFQMVLLQYIMGSNATPGGTFTLSSYALVKNENYPTTTPSCR